MSSSSSPPFIPRSGRRWRLAAIAIALAVASLLAILPAEALPRITWPDGGPVSDKLLHFLGFAALGCVLGALFRNILWGMLGLAVFGLILEGAQALSGLGREGDPRDVLANLLGLAIAIFIIIVFRSLCSIWTSPSKSAQR